MGGTIGRGFSGEKGLWSVAEEAFLPRSAFGGGSGVGRWFLFAAALVEAITVAVHLQDVNVMGKPVQQSAGEPLGAEDLRPFVERQIARNQNRRPFVALAEGFKKQLGAGLGQGYEAKLVNDSRS